MMTPEQVESEIRTLKRELADLRRHVVTLEQELGKVRSVAKSLRKKGTKPGDKDYTGT